MSEMTDYQLKLERVAQSMRRDTFAAHAPAEPPTWFVHTPVPGKPEQPTINQALLDEHRQLIDAIKNVAAGTAAYDELEAQRVLLIDRIAAAWNDLRSAMADYRELLKVWRVRDSMSRLVQWRFAFADAMMEYAQS